MLSVYPVLRDDDLLEEYVGLRSTISTFSPYVDLSTPDTYDHLLSYLAALCGKRGASRLLRLSSVVIAVKATVYLSAQGELHHGI